MARKVYFALDYEDLTDLRARAVRNSWVIQKGEAAGFWDTAEWEMARNQDDEAIKRWIDNQLDGTSVTAVLIGTATSERKWVTYEIKKSHEERKGLLGVYLHNIKDGDGNIVSKGKNPFDNLHFLGQSGNKVQLSTIYPSYDWVSAQGSNNLWSWVEQAARKAGRYE
jgi:hypothetical protein